MSPMAVVFMPWQDKAERHLLSTQPSSGIFGVKPHLCSKLQFALIISREVFPRKKKKSALYQELSPCTSLCPQRTKTELLADAAAAREQALLLAWDRGPQGCILCSSCLLEADGRVFCISIQVEREGERVLH